MAHRITTFLMFEGAAEEAMQLYVSVFADSAITHIERYEPVAPDTVGKVKRAEFTLAGRPYLAIDSPAKHAFTFTPSISLFVDCSDEAEQETAFQQLSAGGSVLMPPANYGFSRRFAWINDRFGVSWQLNVK
jgi:predicted 3-demethylubiquinone-9 3-methyltransferase (glyoxalase superfamily)